MAMEITVQVPKVLERGLREILAEQSGDFQDENTIMGLLTSQPKPEQVLAIHPSPELQARMSELLDQNKSGVLSRQEEVELERYLTLEHLVRLAKAHAHRQSQIHPDATPVAEQSRQAQQIG